MGQQLNFISITPKLSRFGKLLVLMALLIIAGNTQAAHVYWKPATGSDSNPGTVEQPVKTLAKAIEVLKAQYQANPNPSPDWIIIQMESWVIGASENGEIVIDGKIDDTHNALVLRLPNMRDYMIKYTQPSNSGANTLKLSNITFHGNSTQNAWSEGNGNQNNPIIVIGENRTVIMEDGCVLTENQHTHPATEILNGAGVVINGGGTLVMNGGEISKCKSNNYGGGVYGQNGATFIMNGGKIDNCFAAGTANYGESNAHPRGSGGGVYMGAGSTLTMAGGEISNCTAYQFGGGVKVQGSADNQSIVTITKCNVHHCIANGPMDNYGRGGGFDFGSNVEITIDGPEVLIHNNRCQCYGGGIQIQAGPVVYFKNGKIYENKAVRTTSIEDAQLCGAAGIHSTTNSQFIMTGGEVYGNYTPGVGGAIHSSYEGTMEITGGKLYNNHAACQGGAINLNTNCNLKIPDGSTVEMYGNTAGRGGAVCCDAANVWIYDGSFHDNHAVDTVQTNTQKGFGGAFELVMERTQAGHDFLPSNMFIYGGEIYNNTAAVDGGAIHMKKNVVQSTAGIPTILIQGGKIHDNIAYKGNGGAIFADDQTKFYMEPNTGVTPATEGAIYDNESQLGSGGAVYLEGSEVYISAGSFTKNKAHLDGGGFFVNGNIALVNIKSGQLLGNEAGRNGGGFYVNGGSVTITGGTIQSNTATTGNGGGFYSAGGTVNISKATVSANHAEKGFGGGLYSAAGITVGTTATGSGATVSGNHARNGAGFYVAQTSGTTTTIQGGSTISDNIATEDGAGAYIASGNLSILFSDIKKNEATRNGGGIYASASSVVTMSDGDIADNQAKNGGGIYLATGANMTMSNGLIRYNKAVSAEDATLYTAYHAGSDPDIQGVGGGIYLSAGTSDTKTTKLTFVLPETVGIYGNTATLGADEIFADGLNTQIAVPEVEGMTLSDYPATVDGWYEDYITDDTSYAAGTNIAPPWAPVRRYEDYIANGENPYLVPYTTASEANKYICLRLGGTTSLIITKTGMAKGETAIFKVSKPSAEIQKILYTVSITAGDDGSGSATIKVPMGEYTVQETDWSWAYAPDASDGKITQDISRDNTFTFTNTPKENVPLHGESYKNNVFGTPGE